MPKGGKIIRPDGTVANGRKKLADPKVQTTCYFLKSAIEKLGKEQCRLIAEQAVNEAALKQHITAEGMKCSGLLAALLSTE